MATRNFFPRCTAFFNRIPIELLKICNLKAMHLGKKFLAAIFSAILYSSWTTICTIFILKIPSAVSGAQLRYFKGRGFVVEIGRKDIGFPIETFRAIA